MAGIPTRFLIISDTHGDPLNPDTWPAVDVAIHCGDLTDESKMEEFRESLELLKGIKAPLKLVIAGNHDLTLDEPLFRRKIEANPSLDAEDVRREYGDFGEARALWTGTEAAAYGIHFLDEGTHRFTLGNGAALTVYASPYTPSLSDWGFQFEPDRGHDFAVPRGADVVITHGPPRGVLDLTDSRQRAGSSALFEAVARARPRLHCFGHIHEAWGAKLVAWRDPVSAQPSHFLDIDNGASVVVENLSRLRAGKYDSPETVKEKEEKRMTYDRDGCFASSHGPEDENPLIRGKHTLFVNAAIQGRSENESQWPWIINISLPVA